jgi:hypothetical protein
MKENEVNALAQAFKDILTVRCPNIDPQSLVVATHLFVTENESYFASALDVMEKQTLEIIKKITID